MFIHVSWIIFTRFSFRYYECLFVVDFFLDRKPALNFLRCATTSDEKIVFLACDYKLSSFDPFTTETVFFCECGGVFLSFIEKKKKIHTMNKHKQKEQTSSSLLIHDTNSSLHDTDKERIEIEPDVKTFEEHKKMKTKSFLKQIKESNTNVICTSSNPQTLTFADLL